VGIQDDGSTSYVGAIETAAEFGLRICTEVCGSRGTVKPLVPVESGKPKEFRLHVDGGGKPATNDPPTLNFRI
jgi:hypothetical protein